MLKCLLEKKCTKTSPEKTFFWIKTYERPVMFKIITNSWFVQQICGAHLFKVVNKIFFSWGKLLFRKVTSNWKNINENFISSSFAHLEQGKKGSSWSSDAQTSLTLEILGQWRGSLSSVFISWPTPCVTYRTHYRTHFPRETSRWIWNRRLNLLSWLL